MYDVHTYHHTYLMTMFECIVLIVISGWTVTNSAAAFAFMIYNTFISEVGRAVVLILDLMSCHQEST